MASYHIQINTGAKGKALEHAQYIGRDGPFTEARYGEVAARGQGNMPAWAREDTTVFWQASDEFERVNGNTYREFELALPRELSPAARVALVERFAENELATRPYQWAIHGCTASDGKEQPHVHLMFSDRQLDGIERGPEQFFKRYNAKNPERGGAKKFAYGADKAEAALAYEGIRERWATVQNRALEAAGVEARVDHRSLAAQGIHREPGVHRGPAVSGIEARGEVSQVGERQREQVMARSQARAAVVAEVQVVTREEVAAERVAVRERRALAREVAGEDRQVVLPLVEADRREQLGRAQAAAERRVERRQGLGIGGALGKKLVDQARALRARIGTELKRVKAWVREHFPDPLHKLRDRDLKIWGAKSRNAEAETPARQKSKRSAAEQSADRSSKPTLEQIQRQSAQQWREMREQALKQEAKDRQAAAALQREMQTPQGTAKERAVQLAALSSSQLKILIDDLRPAPEEQLVEQDKQVDSARRWLGGLQERAQIEGQRARQAVTEAHAWREAHGAQAKLHDLKIRTASFLARSEAERARALEAQAQLLKEATAAQQDLDRERGVVRERVTRETAPARETVRELEGLRQLAVKRETRVQEFEQLAQHRASGDQRYQDGGEQWQATPAKLRTMVDSFNRQHPQVQAEVLKTKFVTDTKLTQEMDELLERRRQHVRSRDQGHER